MSLLTDYPSNNNTRTPHHNKTPSHPPPTNNTHHHHNQIPLHILEKGGSLAIAGILNVMVPRFVKILSKDYERWSLGDDSRGAVAQDLDERLVNDA